MSPQVRRILFFFHDSIEFLITLLFAVLAFSFESDEAREKNKGRKKLEIEEGKVWYSNLVNSQIHKYKNFSAEIIYNKE